MTGAATQNSNPDLAYSGRQIAVSAGDKTLVQIADLSIEKASVTGLIGHNGSGKSTLLKALARQTGGISGDLRLLGNDIASWNAKTFARNVAYLPQDPPPARGLLVRELVALGRYPWHGAFGRFSKADVLKTEEAMRLTDIEPLAGRLVDTLSGGERQRAWIAMMVAQDAKCLLLDEPISALDVAHQVEILALVRNLSRARDLAVVVVLHDINMAARYCDRLIALKGGRCVADNRPEHLLSAQTLKDIYGIAMNVVPHPSGKGVLAYVD
ncbi:ATP-binding cassette domain-containing protein [Roseibium sp. RKSG952]|uniref:ATP-binding cassette domain-containing protein n=1 Tax=Roseibium sp. RKSG952 TaxID=2529384 RepID=UPI0012BC2E16|nr:ATP-binding cassette domain-containing protein [Roseibium sp. RKSG952]MTH95635.1 ATP-binding cassette domain-containing protein [Roseibium sp. RKSG952]